MGKDRKAALEEERGNSGKSAVMHCIRNAVRECLNPNKIGNQGQYYDIK